MEYKTREELYKQKSSEELYKIFLGYNRPTLAEMKCSLKILEERKFDFNKAEQKLTEWKARDTKKEKNFENEHPILTFLFYKRGSLISILCSCTLLLIFTQTNISDFNKMPGEIKIFTIVIIINLILGLILGMYIQKLINKRKINKN